MLKLYITKFFFRLDSILPKVRQAKDDVESLWKAYTVIFVFNSSYLKYLFYFQFTDELTPHLEWLNDKADVINKPLITNGAEETEQLIERLDNIINQLGKKKKVSMI